MVSHKDIQRTITNNGKHLKEPLCLPTCVQLLLYDVCTHQVTSWGNVRNAARFNKPEDQVLVKEIEVQVLPHRHCYLQEKNFFSRFLRPGLNFCAGRPAGEYFNDPHT
jgi:hypothetical protein